MFSNVPSKCQEHNRRYRDVTRRDSLNLNEFLNHSSGNLFITGGSPEERGSIVCRFAEHTHRTDPQPIIIFSNSLTTRSGLTDAAHAGLIKPLFITSPDHRNYSMFCGLTADLCSDYFAEAALNKGYSATNDIHGFCGAFFSTLSAIENISMESVTEFSKNSDTDIAAIAINHGDVNAREMLTSSVRGGVDFRRLLGMTNEAFSLIADPTCSSGYSISGIDSPCVAYISTVSANPSLMSLYFMHALKNVMYRKATIIFDDTILLNTPAMVEFVQLLKQLHNISLVVACENPVVLPSVTTSGEDYRLSGFSRHIILLNDTVSPDLQNVLSSLGSYNHFEAISSESTPHHLLFSLEKSETSGTTTYSRPKVLLEEELGRVILRGAWGNSIISVAQLR